MGVVGSSGGNLRASGRQIGRRCSDSVFLLQARERPELAPSSGVGFEQTEDVNHWRGAQTTFDRALDVAEREGWSPKCGQLKVCSRKTTLSKSRSKKAP